MSRPAPLVAIIVLNWNNWRDTVECLDSLQRITYPQCCALVVDNGSTDNSEEILRERFPALDILQTGVNLGYAGGNNRGLRWGLEQGAEYLCVLNNDVVVEPGFLEPLVTAMEADPRLGVAGGLQCSYENRRLIQSAGSYYSLRTGVVSHRGQGQTDQSRYNHIQDVDFISGSAFLARAEMVRVVGFLDESFFLYSEEVDWCLRAKKAGWRVRYVPGSRILHKVSATVRTSPALYTYYGLRSRLWVLRRHSSTGQFALFLTLFFLYYCPKMIVGRLVKRESKLLGPLLHAMRDGFGPMPSLNRTFGHTPRSVPTSRE